MKNTIKTDTLMINIKDQEKVKIYKDIVAGWLSANIDTTFELIENAYDIEQINKRVEKGGSDISEAMSLHWLASETSSKYFYINQHYHPNVGEAKGIDGGLFNDQNIFVAELKYTHNNPSSNFTEVVSQLKSRFRNGEHHQLNQLSHQLEKYNRDDITNLINDIYLKKQNL